MAGLWIRNLEKAHAEGRDPNWLKPKWLLQCDILLKDIQRSYFQALSQKFGDAVRKDGDNQIWIELRDGEVSILIDYPWQRSDDELNIGRFRLEMCKWYGNGDQAVLLSWDSLDPDYTEHQINGIWADERMSQTAVDQIVERVSPLF